ncbi:MAG TPA: carbohydrate binding domain-containing protein [Tepidisphaeraceae bacterium]|nr:carbohydrate binding domain-containing protein [Tepidisphaeraceae bacterium]
MLGKLIWTCLLAALISSPAAGQTTAAAPANLVPNPGLEDSGGKLVKHWEAMVIGAPAEFAIDASEKHGGNQSIRVWASEVTRSYLHSAPTQVAPGEKLNVSAWVKVRDVPPDQGRAVVIAEFSRGHGTKETVAMVGWANPTEQAWQQIENTITVPPNATTLRLRLGFSYSYGTTWWDDVAVSSERPVVSRIALPGPRVSPALDALPVEILNRDGSKGNITIRATLGKENAEAKVELSGEPAQVVNIPIKVVGRGEMELSAALFRGETELSSETRKAMVPKQPLVLLPPVPTHWVIEDGNPRVAGEVDLAVPKNHLDGGVLTARLVDSGGKEYGSWSSAGKALVDGVNPFFISADAMQPGEYQLAVELKPRRGEAIRAQRDWSIIPRSRARVTLNESGYLVHDGRAIFPLGIFNGGARMKEMGEAGFTVSHAYNAVEAEVGGRLDDVRAMDFLDNTQANGMKALMLIPRQLLFAGDWDGVRRRIRMFRNHPGLLAWDEEEGLARGDIRIETLAKLRQVLNEEDPHHPLMVGDSKDVIGRIEPQRRDFFPLDYMDLGMWWWYPIPLGGGKPEALEGDEGKPGTKELVPPSWLVNANTDKPLWAGVQSYKKPVKNVPGARYPSPTEYRAQAYIALIHGAKGLMWYGGSVNGGAYLSPEESNWDDLKKLAGELNEMGPVFMGKTQAAPTFSPADAPLSVMLKRVGDDRLVLIAANRGSTPVDVTFQSPALKAGQAKVLYENRSRAATAGGLADTFEPYAVHVYELTR